MHPIPSHFLVPLYLPFTPAASLPKRKLKKLKQINKKPHTLRPSVPVLPPFITSSFVLVVLGAVVYHTGYPFVRTALPVSIHCNELLVWFKSFGTSSILYPHWNFFWISCCCPKSWRSCDYGSTGPVSSHLATSHRWGRCWDMPTQSPGFRPG